MTRIDQNRTNSNNSNLLVDKINQTESKNSKKFEKMVLSAEKELHRLARSFLYRENINHSFQSIDLINETLIKLIGQRQTVWQNQAHFMAISAKIMRRVLINHARDRIRQKRGGAFEHCSIDDVEILSEERSKQFIDLDEALGRLEKLDKLKSQIVELRFFSGMTVEETARELDISPTTVWHHWRFAKAWISREIC